MGTNLTTNASFDEYAARFGWVYNNGGKYREEYWEWYAGKSDIVLLRQPPDRVCVVRFSGPTPFEIWSGAIRTSDDFDHMTSSMTAKPPCGCEFTIHRPGGEFLLFAGDIQLGRSGLEYEDSKNPTEGAWLRSGLFTPTEAYSKFQDLFQQHTRLAYAALPAERERHRAEIDALRQHLDALHLRLVHPDGTEIPVAELRLQDCAYALTNDSRELQVVIRDRKVHDKFFSQSLA